MNDYSGIKEAQYNPLANALSPTEESKMQYLQRVKKSMQANIELIDRAITLLEKNPEFAELHDLLRRI